MKSTFEKLGGTYQHEGDYLLPNVEVPKSPAVGIWGERRRKYLREYQKPLYTAMLLGDTLNAHLEEVDRSATEMFDRLIEQLKHRDGITEELKAANQLAWVQRMNVIRQEAAEIVTNHFTRDRNGNHPALIAPGWKRAVRLDSLGEKYTPDAIYDRIIDNQRLPELYVTYYPTKRRTPLVELEWEMKRLNRMSSIELMFELFVAMLKLCTGTNFSEDKSVPLSPQLREEVRKLDQYNDDMKLLCKYHIGTAEELSAFREETIPKIHALVQERTGIYNKIRRAAEPEKTELKQQAKAISQQIAPLRKELKCADRIWKRSLDTVQNLLDQERQLEEHVMNRYKERSYER